MTRVFIGSTSIDLGGYRAMAIEVVNRHGMTPIAMEFFEAAGHPAAEESRRKIDDSDVYVGIFAHRYGHIDPEDGRSITELEFDHAAARGLERLCFVVDPEYPWPPDGIDFDNYARVKALRERVGRTLVRARFTTVDNFGLLLSQSLDAWKQRNGHMESRVRPAERPRPSTLPPPPPLVVGRDNDVREIRARLTRDGRPRVVVRGWPGVGKTTTVLAIARDPEVSMQFPDGVLWASLGKEPDVAAELGAWARALGHPLDRGASIDEATRALRTVLAERRTLLIVDDVWSAESAAAFDVAGARAAMLFTTRLTDVARAIAIAPQDICILKQLSDEDAFALIAQLAPNTVRRHRDQLAQLIADLEGLPLALRVAARLLEAETTMGWGIDDLLRALAESRQLLAERAPEDRFDPRTGSLPTVDALLRQSTDMLDPDTRDRFALLGAFAPKPATFDLQAMGAIWEVDDPRPTARTLSDRGLLEPLIGTGRFQLHALLKDHAASLLT